MSFVQVDSSVRTNRKFLRAGPAASWLWLCGNAYCQETLTDGFIPFEAVRYLGVEHPKPLIPKLVSAGLWDAVDGGWNVHDYLQYNKSAKEIRELKKRRGEGGKLGGRPTKEPSSETLEVSDKVNLPENPYTSTASTSSTPSATDTSRSGGARPQTIIQPRRKDAAWEGGRVWVPQRIHNDFLGYRNGEWAELFDWYEAVDRGYAGEIDPSMFEFWRARYREKWPSKPEAKGRFADWKPKGAA